MCWINELMTIKNGRLEAKMTRKCISVLMSFRLTLKILFTCGGFISIFGKTNTIL